MDEIEAAINAGGVWERFVEVRMSAGPTIRIGRPDGGSESYEVVVSWGDAQDARSRVHGLDAAVETADRLASALYDIRSGSRVADG
jgi:hypothetical protein